MLTTSRTRAVAEIEWVPGTATTTDGSVILP